MATTEPTPSTPSASAGRRWGRWLLRGVGWVFTALLLAVLAIGLWAGTEGSLARTLGWAEQWMQGREDTVGRLHTEGVTGSLRHGGQLASLQWSRGRLSVRADKVQAVWSDALWLGLLSGRGIQLGLLGAQTLRVDDQRDPTPGEPMTALPLPMAVRLDFRLDQLELSGKTALTLSNIQGRYQYGSYAAIDALNGVPPLPGASSPAHAHHLRLDSLQLADGHYSARMSLGAEAPMPLALELQGQVETRVPDGAGVSLNAQARASGTLSGPQATLDLTARANGHADSTQGGTSALSLQARVMPWASQPVVSAVGDATGLNLAALWPKAPTTDLNGHVQARSDGDAWRARLRIDNRIVGPADQHGLPIRSLHAEVDQQGDRWSIPKLIAELGDGQLQGQGSVRLQRSGGTTRASEWQGEWHALGVRPALLWSGLAQGALDGHFIASAASTPQSPHAVALQARVQVSERQPPGAELTGLHLKEMRVQGLWQPTEDPAGDPGTASRTRGLLALSEAHLAIAGAELDGSGRFDTGRMGFDGQLHLRVPGAHVDAQGLLAHAEGQGQTALQLDDAGRVLGWLRSLQELPFVGARIRTALAGQQALVVGGQANAELQWQGGWGALGYPAPTTATATDKPPALPRLQASISVPRLSFQSSESATTTLQDTVFKADGPLDRLGWNAQATMALATWRATLASAGELHAQAPASGGALDLSELSLRVLPQPQTEDASAAVGQGWSVRSAGPLRLGWKTVGDDMAVDGGSGELRVSPLGPHAPALDAPIVLGWQRLLWQAKGLETQGHLQGLTLPWIQALAAPAGNGLPTPGGVHGDLVLDGAWNAFVPSDPGTPMDVSATLQRRSGDLQWAASADSPPGSLAAAAGPIAAGVRDARISLVVKDRQAQATLRWDTERLGTASADFTTPLGGGRASADAAWIDRWWPASAPLRGTAQAHLPQVGVWSMFAPPGWRMSGTLNADAVLGGTRGAPEWRGSVQADQLALRSVVDGFAFTNGQLRATLAGERIAIERFNLQGPGGAEAGGTLEASGQAEWRAVPGSLVRQPHIELKAQAKNLRVSNRADRRLALTGEIDSVLDGKLLQLRGQLKADSALFILPDEMAPSLGKDVVVRSTRTLPVEDDSQRVRPDVSVALDLGPQFEVRGQGIQTRLEGQVTVRATPALPTPRALGEVRAVSGTYRAYGQQLNIENGVLRFTGAYDNPSLDILAVRQLPENTDQRVGVQITGDVQAPRVALFADPDLPDSDKLAWLVLGRPASAAGAQAFVLQQAARRLLSRGGEPIDSTLAKTLGIDEIAIGSASSGLNSSDPTTQQTAVTLGKRLSNDLYLSYEQSLAGAMSTVSILYDLSKSLTLRARAGTENAVDLIFTHRYE